MASSGLRCPAATLPICSSQLLHALASDLKLRSQLVGVVNQIWHTATKGSARNHLQIMTLCDDLPLEVMSNILALVAAKKDVAQRQPISGLDSSTHRLESVTCVQYYSHSLTTGHMSPRYWLFPQSADCETQPAFCRKQHMALRHCYRGLLPNPR